MERLFRLAVIILIALAISSCSKRLSLEEIVSYVEEDALNWIKYEEGYSPIRTYVDTLSPHDCPLWDGVIIDYASRIMMAQEKVITYTNLFHLNSPNKNGIATMQIELNDSIAKWDNALWEAYQALSHKKDIYVIHEFSSESGQTKQLIYGLIEDGVKIEGPYDIGQDGYSDKELNSINRILQASISNHNINL